MPPSTPPSVLIIPGYTNSGPQHWQSRWQSERPDYRRVEQRDWDSPEVTEWTETLDREVHVTQSPVVLVAHSLGCLTVVHWVRAYPRTVTRVVGAFLVAPPDVEHPDTPEELRSFAPIPSEPLPFQSIVVASTTDPYSGIGRAHEFAISWGAHFVNVGDAGHINTASGLGTWGEGQQLFKQLLADIYK